MPRLILHLELALILGHWLHQLLVLQVLVAVLQQWGIFVNGTVYQALPHW